MPRFMLLNDSILEVGPTSLRDVGIYVLKLLLQDSEKASMKYTMLVTIIPEKNN
jgi:hypothetical protein